MSMTVEIHIKGLALCYARDDVWNVVFICDDVHTLDFTEVDSGNTSVPLHKTGKDRNVSFNIGSSPISNPVKGANFDSIFNLRADYAHDKTELKMNRTGNTDIVWLKIPSATLDTAELTPRKYFVQEAKLGFPVRIIDQIAHDIKATFEITDGSNLGVSINDQEETIEMSFKYQDGKTLKLEFDNDCGDNCRENDFIYVYDVIEAVDGKKYVAGQIKNTNVVFSDANGKNKNVILSAETGNCDPIGIDPPPYGNGP